MRVDFLRGGEVGTESGVGGRMVAGDGGSSSGVGGTWIGIGSVGSGGVAGASIDLSSGEGRRNFLLRRVAIHTNKILVILAYLDDCASAIPFGRVLSNLVLYPYSVTDA